MLEYKSARMIAIEFKGVFEGCVKDLNVIVFVHRSIVYLTAVTESFPGHTPPEHRMTTSMLDCWLEMKLLKFFPISHPAILDAIRVPKVYLRFVREDDSLPIIDCPVYMRFGPLVAFILLLGCQVRFLVFSPCLKSDLAKVIQNAGV